MKEIMERLAAALREVQKQTQRVRHDDPMRDYSQVGTIALYECDRALQEYDEWKRRPKLPLELENDTLKEAVARLREALDAYASAANTCPIFGHPGYQLLGWNRKRLDAAYDQARAAQEGR